MQLSDKNLSIGIWSEDHEKLAKWYEEVLGFKVRGRTDLPNDMCIDFDFGDNFFFIGKHSEIKRENMDPYRIMVGFNVGSVTKAFEDLKEKDVVFIAEPFEGPPGGFWCMTIKDPEGNILQFYGER